MNKSLHMKLVLIMLLLIVSLMAVVCVFLVRGVLNFFQTDFYDQMQSAFSRTEFVSDLRSAAEERDAPHKIAEVLGTYVGILGIDSRNRNYYVLDGESGTLLTSSAGDTQLQVTPNILAALSGREGYASDSLADYMDVALPLDGTDSSYIIYIRDNKQNVQDLDMELFLIILQALVIGLAISLFLSFILAKTMVTPLQSLTAAAERVSAGDFSEIIDVRAKDEIGVLTNTFNDMAHRLQATMEAIENERNKLSTVFLHMTDGVLAFSRDGALIHANPAAARMLERPLQPDSGSPGYGEVFGAFLPLEEVLALQTPDFRSVSLSIGPRELEIHLAPFSGAAALGGVLAVIHDVTQQRKADDLRREFVANVSHELRTPITSIRSYAETLADSADVDAETEKRFLHVIMNESDRMTKIVQDLLVLSQLDAEGAGFKFEKFSIRRSVEDVCAAIVLEAKRRGHNLTVDTAPNLPEIDGDRARIEQVILNIVSNAVKYTPDGGRIAVTAQAENENVVIRVQDNGIGIPEADMPRIFDRFYRVDKARSRESGGTGLGLSIAREIAELHGGSIAIASTFGQGTTVTLTLPIEHNGVGGGHV